MLVAAATIFCAAKGVNNSNNVTTPIQQQLLYIYILAISFEAIVTMPTEEADSSEDDSSVVLEGGRHMFWHDFSFCYSYVGWFLIDLGQVVNTILPK